MQRLPASPTPSLSSDENGNDQEYEGDESERDRSRERETRERSKSRLFPGFPKLQLRWPWRQEKAKEGGRISVDIAERADLFAREVCITGWKVVGAADDGAARVGAYVVYDVEVSLRSGASITISRRYTRFVELRRELRLAYPHLTNAIPSLPGKTHMSKFAPEFLEQRRPRLQRFLRAVMLHPEMGVGGDTVVGRWVLN